MSEPMYLEISAQVRYWEDAQVNRVADKDGGLIPFRVDNLWCPIIRLSDGQVMEWPEGVTADIHYKVCDAGEYWLMNDRRQRIAKWSGFYVPDDFLCHGDRGYGDYIIFTVGPDGVIQKYQAPNIRMACESDDDDQSGWIALNTDRQQSSEIGHVGERA